LTDAGRSGKIVTACQGQWRRSQPLRGVFVLVLDLESVGEAVGKIICQPPSRPDHAVERPVREAGPEWFR